MIFRYEEVDGFWVRSPHRPWCRGYSVRVSSDRRLIAYVNDSMRRVALVWDTRAGREVYWDREALYELFRALGGWI